MIIKLATPFNPGDLDPGRTYTHVRLDAMRIDYVNKFAVATFVRGYLDESTFSPGVHAKFDKIARNSAFEVITEVVCDAGVAALLAIDAKLAGTPEE